MLLQKKKMSRFEKKGFDSIMKVNLPEVRFIKSDIVRLSKSHLAGGTLEATNVTR